MAGELVDLIEQAKADPSREHLEEMWRAVFLRKAWYLVPARDEVGPNRPMVLSTDNGYWLPVFTNVRHYRQFAAEVGRENDDGEMHGLMLDPGEALSRILEVDEALDGVVFDAGTSHPFRAPLEALKAYAQQFDVPVEEDSEQGA
jgi:hypothetical protein